MRLNMTEDELVRKLYNKLENMDDGMGYIFDSLIEYWAVTKMALFVTFCKNREILLKKEEKLDK